MQLRSLHIHDATGGWRTAPTIRYCFIVKVSGKVAQRFRRFGKMKAKVQFVVNIGGTNLVCVIGVQAKGKSIRLQASQLQLLIGAMAPLPLPSRHKCHIEPKTLRVRQLRSRRPRRQSRWARERAPRATSNPNRQTVQCFISC